MKKVLIHISRHRIYLPFIQQIAYSGINILANNLHGSIFDAYNQLKPDTVILPIFEYTREFHEFVEYAKDKVKIIVFAGDLNNTDLLNYLETNNVLVVKQGSQPNDSLHIYYEYLYDSKVFFGTNVKRNNKTLVVLSGDNELNHSKLDETLYPNTNEQLVLINNPEFQHPQNIGIANPEDMSRLLNSFHSLIDINNEYRIEAQICGINNISTEGSIKDNITNKIYLSHIDNVEKYSIEKLVSQYFLTSNTESE